MIFILCLLFSLISCSELPIFSGLNVTLSSRPYILNGTYFVQGLGNLSAAFVLDPIGGRMGFDFNIIGKWVVLPNASYIWGQIELDNCSISHVNFTQQSFNWGKAISLAGSRYPGEASFTGTVYDMGSCNHQITLTVKQHNNLLNEQYFSQYVALPLPNPTFCFLSNSYFIADTRSYIFNFDQFFTLRSDCYNPVDYCSFVYPPSNPCVIHPS